MFTVTNVLFAGVLPPVGELCCDNGGLFACEVGVP